MSRGATPTRICPRTARRPLLNLPSPLTAIPAVGIRLSRRTTNKTTVCSASLLTLWLARLPFPIPPSKERWAVQTPPSLPGARFPALPDKESASRRSNGRPETLEPRLGPPPLPHSGVGQKAGPCQVLLLAHGSLHSQLAVDSHALCCGRLQRGVCCFGPLATCSKRLPAS